MAAPDVQLLPDISCVPVKNVLRSNSGNMRCGPHCKAGEICEYILRAEFHQMFHQFSDAKKRIEPKKTKKKTKTKAKDKLKSKKESADFPGHQPPFLAVRSNPSSFVVFAIVRLCVLEKQTCEATRLYLKSITAASTDSESEEEEDRNSDGSRVPKIVGIGLCSVFELVKESQKNHPHFCMRALQALLDMLQGQQPEGLKGEPPEVIDALFDLLLDISSSSSISDQAQSTFSSNLTSFACACLLSLVVARGDTGKLLSAASAMLMSSQSLASEEIPTPGIMASLQRSVHAVLFGKTLGPDWLSHGFPSSALCNSFSVQIPKTKYRQGSPITSDGKYLYILSGGSIYKVGSGFSGTIKGQIIMSRGGIKVEEKGWLGYCKGYVYFQPQAGSCNDLVKIDVETLKEKERVKVDVPEWGPCAFFTDGDNIGLILSTKEDSFIIKMFKPGSSPMPCVHEMTFKLARKCLDVFGSGIFEDDASYHVIISNLPSEDEPVSIACGKDFALLKTVSGKILYSGKAQSLGIKQGGPAMGKWTELPITNSPKIVHYSVGHDGLHALLVAEDGSVFFAGTARRGEDGDQSKGRRQPKPTKPKKMIKLEGQYVVTSACNNGTSALVLQNGELYLFGKDTAHADHNTGLVSDIKEPISQVALGKAHVLAVTNKGQVYTFGINHKGQCGREFNHLPNREVPLPIAMATATEEDGEDEDVESEEPDMICPAGRHQWNHDHCMVCTICGECTGYGASCIASGRPDRNPGLPCGCGAGDSGCIECGCCRSCARENDQDVDVAAAWGQLVAGGLVDNKQTDIIVFDVRCGRAGVRLEDRLRRRIEEYRIRQRRKQMLQSVKAMKSGLAGLNKLRSDVPEKSSPPIVDDVVGSDQEREATKLTSLPPAKMLLPAELSVIQIACGLHHNVLLVQTGHVYTFGNNQHGQLGLGDFLIRGAPTLLKFPSSFDYPVITQVAAGSCHTVILGSQGQVFTFGSNQKGQLRRSPHNSGVEENRKERKKSERDSSWNAVPGLIHNVGIKHGRRATWIGASGDQTFVKIDESLINSHSLSKSSVVCSKSCIGIIPNHLEQASSFKSLVISKADGSCRSFNSADQLELKDSSVCLDSVYNVLWSFCSSTQRISLYNIITTELQSFSCPSSKVLPNSGANLKDADSALPRILNPEHMLPFKPGIPISRAHAALNILSSLDTLTSAQEQNLQVLSDDRKRQSLSKVYSKEDFSVVDRFDSHGGGWGYSGHSIEAIRFMADTDVLLGGFGLFGGRGEYTAKLKVFDIGLEGGEQEIDGDVLVETDEIPYECGARHKFPMLFDEPIQLTANRWYVALARISGPSSDCGSSGQSVVTTEDQIIFYFKSSKKSNNGTDVNAGQIPQLLYSRTITPDSQGLSKPSSEVEPVTVLTKDFSRTVSPDCFQSLLKLLRWAWQSFKAGYCETILGSAMPAVAALMDLERLEYICTSCLHLLKIYINEIYPNGPSKKSSSEVPRLAECVADVRALLQHILSDRLPSAQVKTSFSAIPTSPSTSALLVNYLQAILEECHETFLSCYHAFYPSSKLKWRGLCDLLLTIDVPWVEETVEGDHLLAAVLASLCASSIRLTSTLPVTLETDHTSDSSPLSPDPNADNSPATSNGHAQEMSPGICGSEILKYPVLVDCVNMRTEREGCNPGPCSFREVLDRLLAIVKQPLEAMLHQETVKHSSKLITNACAFIAVIVAELSYQSAGTVLDMHGTTGQVLNITPSRFTKVSQNRTWNTGNGSPDAICFSVDRTGILISGVTVYGGVGNEWHYELELLDDQSGAIVDPSHTQRWKTLAIVRGTFGPEDCYGDVAEIKFERPVPVKENVKYAVRLRNHGSRTNNGDGGLSQVKGPDGTVFTFTDCSLSFNGTNHTRGQIPQILYYSTPQDTESVQSTRDLAELQARRNALSICNSVVKTAAELFVKAQSIEDNDVLCAFGTSHVVTMLLPLIFAHLGPVATSDPRSAVQVLHMVQDLLPLVASLNKKGPQNAISEKALENDSELGDLSTTSNQYAIVESDHPYRPASVANYRVTFPPQVQWLSLEFDPQCGTAQVEDTLQVFVPSKNNTGQVWLNNAQTINVTGAPDVDDDHYTPYWPVFRKFSGKFDWPTTSLLLPGNEVVFSLETASDYVKDDKACFFGFRCQVVGFECPRIANGNNIESWEGLKHLERELAYLGGMCAASLMRRDLILPPSSVGEIEEDMELVEELSQQVYKNHSELLSKGFALAHPPSIHQALEGVLPFSSQSNEHAFLKDFVSCMPGTSGGRLGRWLQPESYVDPKQCELLCSQDELKCNWPAIITVITKDQYGKVVQAPSLKVEVLAVPMNTYDKETEANNPSRKQARVSKPETGMLTFGGLPPPNLETAYEISVKDKMFYYAITVMKEYENYSFEELRYVSPAKKRLIENMLVRPNNDGTYTANWTPGSTGWYLLRVVIDGFEIGAPQQRSVEVKDPPQGLLIPSKPATPKTQHQPNRIRKFAAKFSAGLRVRSHPSLQSEQIGTVHVNDTICFVDELRNDDGVWVRLNPETVRKYCQNGFTEAWCLQYNQHLGKTLLIPVEEPKSMLAEFFKEKGHRRKSGDDSQKEIISSGRGPGVYHVVKCGASGHNIRSRPSLKASAVGMLALGNTVSAIEDITNVDGVWVKLDKDSTREYCFNMDGEAWTLIRSLSSDTMYLRHESDTTPIFDINDEKNRSGSKFSSEQGSIFSSSLPGAKGFDFANSVSGQPFGSFGQSMGIFTFGSGTSDPEGGSSGSTSPFVFGSPASTPPSVSMNTLVESEKADSEAAKNSGGSSNRLSSLQRWLNYESNHKLNSDPVAIPICKEVIPAELQRVSVKEFVKAISESRANGNAASPPRTPPNTPPVPNRSSRSASPMHTASSPKLPSRRSSSPIQIVPPPVMRSSSELAGGVVEAASPALCGSPKSLARHQSVVQDGWSQLANQQGVTPKASGNLRRSSLQSDTSVSSHFSSIFKELSQTSATGCIGCITQRNTISPISTPGTPGTPATPGTPKKETNCIATPKTVTQTGTQTSPDSMKSHFSIGSAGAKEETPRVSPKLARKERPARQFRSKRERVKSPASFVRESNDKSKEKPSVKEVVKEAMTPSVAECLRAVFAAFLWQEGIVHDAMACASFLKFNPTLPKQITSVPHVAVREKREHSPLTKEQKARYRHSVEVASPSLLTFQYFESFSPTPFNANIYKNKLRRTSVAIKEDSVIEASKQVEGLNEKNDSISTTNNVPSRKVTPGEKYQLPLSLQHLVILWEQISSSSLRIVSQQLLLPSPVTNSKVFQRLEKERNNRDKEKKVKKKKEYRPVMSARGNFLAEAAGGPFVAERESMCELCGQFFPHPVTYHMRQAHPGCGDHAGGKGYNSGGNFCGGWAGNCGDGGIGGSSWYLICDRCREKFIRQRGQSMIKEKVKKCRKKTSPTKLLSPLPPMEAHQVMKNNALFLLELSSSAASGIPTNAATPTSSRMSFYNSMPSVYEQNGFTDSSPFPVGSFQCLDVLGVQQQYKNMIGEEFLSEDDIRALQNGAENLGLGSSFSNLSPGIMRSLTMNGGADLQLVCAKRERRRSSKAKDGESKTRTFHRSISVGLTSRDWNKQEGDNAAAECRIIMTRKRNNSSGCEDNSTSFLCQPSAALTKLVSIMMERPGSEFPLHRPVMLFILQRHDLESLQLAMKQALRKAACRVYALQALNWLLRCVTQPMSLHDLLWCFVAALSPAPFDKGDDDGDEEVEKKEHDVPEKDLGVCEHPLSDITIAGEATFPLPQTFHSFLQTVSDLMMLLPVGSALQQIAMRCWCLKFHPEDHSFLHRSHVFSNISKILSRTEEDDDSVASDACAQVSADIQALKDLTPLVDIKASSRQAMVNSLTDNTTETFWESGDEDRKKVKMLSLSCGFKTQPKMVYLHIDNCRDLGNKVSGVSFKAGPTFEEMVKLRQIEVETRYIGWLSCDIPDGKFICIRLELKGPDNTLRLRQVKVLGSQEGESIHIGKKVTAMQIQQKNCEAETLKVFRLLTSQVFGRLIAGEHECDEDIKNGINQDIDRMQLSQSQSTLETNDLKEHMVGILFSRSKLTHLQKQVCSHIVAAIRKEASRVREEWEALLCSKSQSVEDLPKSSDAYCFEMLSMVLALSGSSVGRSYLAQQAGLLRDLFSLLHTGSARVQRQVTSLLRRVLPEVSPPTLASILGVTSLPPSDFSIITDSNKDCKQEENGFDIHKTGILDVFLSCIAKALTVQTKVKGSSSLGNKGVNTVTLATSIHPRDNVGSRWWLRGCMTRKLAEVIIQLLKDMATGKLTDAWAMITKGAIAENILNLTKLEERHRSPAECLRTPTLWLALASLCVLDQEHVERLSSGQWAESAGGSDGQQAQPRPFCDNHDDSETPAIILCSTCGNLCAECDRYLHLSRKTRSHQRQVFKEEEEAIKVDLHEGCGRTKLFWVMSLADSRTLKAMVEFREGTRGKPNSSGVCRFCGSSSSTGLLSIGNVCNEPECQEYAANACSKMLPCGHMCGGICNESTCLPCLHGCGDVSSLKQDADDMCMICFIEALAYAPALQLSCGHVFHLHCCHAVLSKKWSGPRITFRFSLCPICQAPMDHPVLKDYLEPARNLFEDVKRKALMRLEYEGLHSVEAITTPGARFFKDPAGFAMDRYAYYVCFKCKKAYYGGEARCDAEAGGGDDYDPTELVCGACSDVSRAQMCPKHGTDFLEYKCRYCCSVAVFFCFGTTHFCNACHDDFQRVTNIPKGELPHCPAGPKAKQLEGEECPLHVKHPSTGEEFALGCGVCRNAHTF